MVYNYNKDYKINICQNHLDALYDIATVRQCYSEACTNVLEETIKINTKLQVGKINVNKINLSERPTLTAEESKILDKHKNSSYDNMYKNELESLSNKLDNLSEVLDLVHKIGDNDIVLLKAQEEKNAHK